MTSLDVLRATFPAGTLTGAPKVRAMEIIDELEPVKRGIYGGAVGYLSFAGDMDVAIAIRTGIVKDGMLYVQAAAGIVADSVPEMRMEGDRSQGARAVARGRAGRGGLRWRSMSMLLMIDNYDSFTYNLVQYFGELGADVRVFRNDEITLDGIAALRARRSSCSRPGRARRPRPASASPAIRALRRQAADPRRLPRPPGDRRGVRRQGRARAAR